MRFKVQQIVFVVVGILLIYLPAMVVGDKIVPTDQVARGIEQQYPLLRFVGFLVLGVTGLRYLIRPSFVDGRTAPSIFRRAVRSDDYLGGAARFLLHVDRDGNDLDA